ncbi:MAG: glycosyltransferase [Candidatus Saccharibacteria bacterium]
MSTTQRRQKIAIIGPSHPYKGGIVMETTELAHQLSSDGADVTLCSWRSQYPSLLYPGSQFTATEKPERPLFSNTIRTLAWYNPLSWWRLGRRLRTFDQIIFIWWLPTIQGPIYLTIGAALGRSHAERIVLCHNVLPHEGKPGDRAVTRLMLKHIDRVLVHTPAQAAIASELTNKPIATASLPLALPGTVPTKPLTNRPLKHQLLYFGIVRPYKGLDVLLHAIAELPDVHLVVAGEFWGGSELYTDLIEKLAIANQVTIHTGYASDYELADYFAACDALVLPYRNGTASQNVGIGHAFGVPVIATTAGSMAEHIRPGVDGLVCEPNSVTSLVSTITDFYAPGTAKRLQAGIPRITTAGGWQTYLTALVGSDK